MAAGATTVVFVVVVVVTVDVVVAGGAVTVMVVLELGSVETDVTVVKTVDVPVFVEGEIVVFAVDVAGTVFVVVVMASTR